jgi:hypothetical protein
MNNHTPGPWRRNVAGHNEDSWRIVSESKATGYIAFIPPEHEDAEANSRLIAAAPDLLAALRAAVEYLGCALAGANLKATGYDREAGVEEYQAALAAIAKAEGRGS